jgi:hypothetical protein
VFAISLAFVIDSEGEMFILSTHQDISTLQVPFEFSELFFNSFLVAFFVFFTN